MTEGNVLEVSGLTHSYGEVVAISHLDLEVPPGVIGLVGANGAGKTTLLRLMLGLLQPATGTMRVMGADPRTEPLVVRSRIGYMPEGDCVPLDQTAAGFVSHAAELAGIPPREARRRSSETLFLVGLEEERFRFMGDFSTGMRQRVKLAQAIVHDPDLLLLDEPASGLDPEGRSEMLQLIQRLASFEINVIVSSHVLSDIEQTCDWVVMLDAGRLLRSGPLERVNRAGPVMVELIDGADLVADALRRRGYQVSNDESMMMVGQGEDGTESAVVEEAARAGAGLVRMTRGTASLEDLFYGTGEAT